jgi:septum formation protein
MNPPTPKRLYLASRSPRRRELLHQIGVSFETLLFRAGSRSDAQVDETPLAGEVPVDYVQRIARAKAAHGKQLAAERRLMVLPVLSADTTLELDDSIIGKPNDAADALRILKQLSGRTHRVLTSVALAYGDRVDCALSTSEVTFRPLDELEMRRYVLTGEPLDKAGAYGIQGRAAVFIERLAGSYTGVMGLPLFETAALLDGIGFKF